MRHSWHFRGRINVTLGASTSLLALQRSTAAHGWLTVCGLQLWCRTAEQMPRARRPTYQSAMMPEPWFAGPRPLRRPAAGVCLLVCAAFAPMAVHGLVSVCIALVLLAVGIGVGKIVDGMRTPVPLTVLHECARWCRWRGHLAHKPTIHFRHTRLLFCRCALEFSKRMLAPLPKMAVAFRFVSKPLACRFAFQT